MTRISTHTASILSALALLSSPLAAQPAHGVRLEVRFSTPAAVFDFLRHLAPNARNGPLRTLFTQSEFNTEHYRALIAAFDSIKIDYEYAYPQYPRGQKIEGSPEYSLRRNLVLSADAEDFRTRSVGLIPMSDLNRFASIIAEFTPVYTKVVYEPSRVTFERQLKEVDSLVRSKHIAEYFEQARLFYRSAWDPSIPYIFVFHPQPGNGGYTGTAFGNIAESVLPTGLTEYSGVLSAMMHEVSHILLDEEPLDFKRQLDAWFTSNPSLYSRFALGLMQEAWATAVGGGYFYEKLAGALNPWPWYGWRYNDLMAREIFPDIKAYLDQGKPIDKALIDRYVAAYETKFPGWIWEWDNLMTGRTVVSENPADFALLDRKFPYRSVANYLTDYSSATFDKLRDAGTKLLVVSRTNASTLELIRRHYPELADWRPDATTDFTSAHLLQDQTRLIVVNLVNTTLEKQLESPLHP